MFEKTKRKSENTSSINKGTGSNVPNLTKEFFTMQNWIYKKRNINMHIENNKMVIESKKNKVSYLSLFEKNSNFNKSPSSDKGISLNKDSLFRVTGSSSENMKVTIYVIEYSIDGKKIKTNRLFLNKETEVGIHPKTKNIRIAIRILGKGEVCITNFKLIQDYITAEMPSQKGNIASKDIHAIKMACIFDEFSMESFSNEVSLITFTPDNWKSVLSKQRPDFLMVESAWRGNFGSWEFQIGKYNNNEGNRKLKELINWCKRHRIPTVFWNKEDPIHFDKFIGAASLFDYVFTTDANIIYKYKEAVKHNNVYSMQFAANPKEHNPTTLNKVKKNKISFAGSYYANRHPDRRKDMDEMLEITKKFGLEIFDRNYERNKTGDSHFMFPEYLQENIVGTLKYTEINKAYKNYKLILNVNSVKESPTMFSRRVFEGLACGTPIISSFSTGIKKTFNDIVVLSEDKDYLRSKISRLMSDSETYRKVAMAGIREVYRHHTYEQRVEYILDKIRIKYNHVNRDLSVIIAVDSMDEFKKAMELVNAQTYKNIDIVILISIFEGYEQLLNKYNKGSIRTYIKDYAFKYDTVSNLISTPLVTTLDLRNEYGIYYLEDLVHASIYSEADIIGKKSIFDGENYNYADHEYEYVDSVLKGTAIYKVDILNKTSIKEFMYDEERIIKILFKEHGAKIYSGDQFNIKLDTLSKKA